jgi:hypothetical protein
MSKSKVIRTGRITIVMSLPLRCSTPLALPPAGGDVCTDAVC